MYTIKPKNNSKASIASKQKEIKRKYESILKKFLRMLTK
jgi:hypothetical protein